MSDNISTVAIAPSLLACDLLNLAATIAGVESAGADMHHIDVMDGHFVANLSFGLPVITAVKKIAKVPLDVHLMIDNPLEMVENYTKVGVDRVTFHIEATEKVAQVISKIKNNAIKAGLAINPETNIELVFPYLNELDVVTIMSVNPGFGGQAFLPAALQKVKRLRSYIDNNDIAVDIEIDGGINADTAREAVQAGANILAVGTYVYAAADKRQAINRLKHGNCQH